MSVKIIISPLRKKTIEEIDNEPIKYNNGMEIWRSPYILSDEEIIYVDQNDLLSPKDLSDIIYSQIHNNLPIPISFFVKINNKTTNPAEFPKIKDGDIIEIKQTFTPLPCIKYEKRNIKLSCWNKEELENMLENVINELNLSPEMIEKHGQLGTPPHELVKLVLQQKDNIIRNLKAGLIWIK